jgi:hypothetical protein
MAARAQLRWPRLDLPGDLRRKAMESEFINDILNELASKRFREMDRKAALQQAKARKRGGSWAGPQDASKVVRKGRVVGRIEGLTEASLRALRAVAEAKGLNWTRALEQKARRRNGKGVEALLRRLAASPDKASAARAIARFLH